MTPEERIVFLGMFFIPFGWGLWTRRFRAGMLLGSILAIVFRLNCR